MSFKVAVVTGGANGLGREICLALANKGLQVFSIDIVDPTYCHLRIKHFPGDTRDFEHLQSIAQAIGKINVLVNNASVNRLNWIEKLPEDDWNLVMDTNLKGYFLTVKAFLPYLKKTKGTIANVCSSAAFNPMTCSIAYNVSKAGQLMMTRQMARELTREYGITVFSITPNKLKGTKMTKYVDNIVPEIRGWSREEADTYQQQALLAGNTDPKVVAENLAHLLAKKERHQYLTGCNLEFGQEGK